VTNQGGSTPSATAPIERFSGNQKDISTPKKGDVMNTQNTYKKAILNRLRILKYLNRFGWLRTRDIAAILWLPTSRGNANAEPDFAMVSPTASGIRMAQRTMRDLQKTGFVLQTKAPDGAMLFALSQKGADTLKGTGIDARSGKDLLRAHSFCYYRHRCISTEIGPSQINGQPSALKPGGGVFQTRQG
jgi:hypothetical protein